LILNEVELIIMIQIEDPWLH